jgi:glycerate 2-kinase
VIASGPTVPDPTTYGEAYGILEEYYLLERTPSAILKRLQKGMRGDIPETPKPGDPLFERVQNVIIGSNSQAASAALAAAAADGFHTLLLTTFLQGEARQAGSFLGSLLRQIAASGQPLPRPACLIAGGETTVTLHALTGAQGVAGLGGRNQELALGAVIELAGLPDVLLVALATDGGDGPTDAAGAVVTGETLGRAKQFGLDPADFLRRNDAYHFFAALDDLLKPGPTQTNVNDLTLLFAL